MVMKYRDYLLGVVSDVEFPRDGELTPEAGFELARMVRDRGAGRADRAAVEPHRNSWRAPIARGLSFLHKRSPTLLGDLRQFPDRPVGVSATSSSACPTAPRWRARPT